MTTTTQEAAMQDDVIKVAQLLMDMDGNGCGYEDQARAAMAATREIDAEALRAEAQNWELMGGSLQANRFDRAADWLQQRANDVRAIGAP